MRFAVNQQIGPYQLVSVLGQGTYGEVWLAVDIRRGDQVAVKFPHPGTVDANDILREANLWSRVGNHPNVLPLREAMIYDNQIVIVTPYAAEGTLRDWLNRNGGFARFPDPAREIMDGILSGLEHLHGLDIVHRDLKPENIVMFGNTPCLIDFGLARIVTGSASVSQAIGTPLYMPPEAFSGERSRQGDQWAAAVIFYEMLTGKLPFQAGGDVMALMAKILQEQPAPLPSSLPTALTKGIFRALSKERVKRFTTIAEMRRTLGFVVDQTTPPVSPPPVPKPGSTGKAILGAVALFCTGVLTTVIAMESRHSVSPAPSPTAIATTGDSGTSSTTGNTVPSPSAPMPVEENTRRQLEQLYHDMDYNYTEKFPGYFNAFSTDYTFTENGRTDSYEATRDWVEKSSWVPGVAVTLQTEMTGPIKFQNGKASVPFRQRIQRDREVDGQIKRSVITLEGEDTWQREESEWKMIRTTITNRTKTPEQGAK